MYLDLCRSTPPGLDFFLTGLSFSTDPSVPRPYFVEFLESDICFDFDSFFSNVLGIILLVAAILRPPAKRRFSHFLFQPPLFVCHPYSFT